LWKEKKGLTDLGATDYMILANCGRHGGSLSRLTTTAFENFQRARREVSDPQIAKG